MRFAQRKLTLASNGIRRATENSGRGESAAMKMARPEVAYMDAQSGGGGFSAGTNAFGYFAAGTQTRTFDAMLPENSEESLIPFYRDIYYYDSIGGSACDMTSSFAFSDWTLSGVEPDRAKVYSEGLARLNMRTLLNEISLHYLVDGDFVGTLIYNPEIKNFQDILIHDRLYCRIVPSPFYSMDPIIQAHTSQKLRMFQSMSSKHSTRALENYPQDLIRDLSSGAVELNPLTTLHVARRSLADRMSGSVSYLKRVLPVYLLEKTLYRGSLVEFNKRLRATTHIQVGEDTWVPTTAEMQDILHQFQSTEIDPLGAWIVTRQGVQVQDVRCLPGKTLIPTDFGLRRIDELVPNWKGMEPDTHVPVDFKIKGASGRFVKASKFWYRGFQSTVKITTESGATTSSTKNHRFLTVINGELDLVKAKDLIPNSTWLLRDRLGAPNEDQEELDIPYEGTGRKDEKLELYPEYMTPELAYCLALIISEGYVNQAGVYVSNSNRLILDQYAKWMNQTFGVTINIDRRRRDSKSTTVRGVHYHKDVAYVATINSRSLVRVLEYLGLARSEDLRTERSPSYRKSVPWCVRHANSECHAAFIAGYMDGDGTVKYSGRGLETKIRSTSREIVRTVSIMLSNLGVIGLVRNEGNVWNVSMSRYESYHLAKRLKPYMIRLKDGEAPTRIYKQGIPADVFMPLLDSRQLRHKRVGPNGETGSWMLNDNGHEIFIPGGWRDLFVAYSLGKKRTPAFMSYEDYDAGRYARHLDVIRKVSHTLYRTMQKLFRLKYKFERVIDVQENRKKSHVFDLTVDSSEGPPLFVADSFITKNSGGEFARWTDYVDQLVNIKLRALCISEAFLSGDANFSTGEAALTSFMENIDSFRNFITFRTFNYKIFPLIAMANGFYKKGEEPSKDTKLEDVLFNLNNHKGLDIPKVVWNKDLTSVEGRSRVEMLDMLAEKGMPVALRTYAAAAGLDIGTMMSDLSEETEDDFHKLLQEYKSKMGAVSNEEGGSENNYSFGSVGGMKTRPKPLARRALLGRDFGDPEPHTLSRTGKKKAVLSGDHLFMKKENARIAKAAENLRDPEYRQKIKKQIIAKRGSIPKIL